MKDEASFIMPATNEVPVVGLHLSALKLFLADDPARVSFLDLQAALGMDKRTTKRAISLLMRIGYLNERSSSPPRFNLTTLAIRLLTPRACRPISRADGLTVVSKLIANAGRRTEDTGHCWISAVTILGTLLDSAVETLPFVEAQVTFSVTSGEMASIQMRRIEKTFRYIDESLRISVVFNSA